MRGERRGSVVVLVAVLMVVLLGFGAFAVDLSQMQAYKSELRRTADAAALAAALQLEHETNYGQAAAVARQLVQANPVMGDSATVVALEYGHFTGSDFVPISCSATCGDTADAFRVTLRSTGNFYLAQILSGSGFTVNAVATAALPVTATPCVAPFSVQDTIWSAAFPTGAPSPSQLRLMSNVASSKVFVLKRDGGTAPPPVYYGAVNLPPFGQPAAPNGVQQYAHGIAVGQYGCAHVTAGDLLQVKREAFDFETVNGFNGGGLVQLCPFLRSGVCYDAGGQIGVAVRAPIVTDSNDPTCQSTLIYPEDDYGGGTAKCVRVLEVRTFVVLTTPQSASEAGRVLAVYAGTDTAGAVRGYAQRPILVQ